MNLISFANFNVSDNQPTIIPAIEKDGKPEDFSALLNNIFVALQTANSPAPNLSGGFEQNNLQVQTVSDGGQNFVLSNNPILPQNLFSQNQNTAVNTENLVSGKTNINQNILPTAANSDEKVFLPIPKPDSPLPFTPTQNLLSIPENFQPAPKLPTMQNVLQEDRAESNSMNISHNITQNASQENEILNVNPQISAKDFEIVSNAETNIPLTRQHYSFALPINSEQNSKPLQVFKNISDSIRNNDLHIEAAVKAQPIVTEKNLVENEATPTEIKLETVKKNDSPVLKVENNSEKPQIKPSILSDLKSKTESPVDLNLSPKVTTAGGENSVKVGIPNNAEPNEVLETSIAEPKPEVKSVVNPETKVAVEPEVASKSLETKPSNNFEVELKAEVVSEKQSDQVKFPVETGFAVKAEAAREPQINLKANEKTIPKESRENLNPRLSFEQTVSEIKKETRPSQPISLNLDSEIAKPMQVKPQVEAGVSNEFVQPKFENNILNKLSQSKSENKVQNKVFQARIENLVSDENSAPRVGANVSRESIPPKIENIYTMETTSPNLAEPARPTLTFEANKPILTEEDFRELNIQFDKLSKTVSVENKPINFNSADDKIIQPGLAAKPVNPSIAELPKTNLPENAPYDAKPQTKAPPIMPKTLTEEVNQLEIKADKPALTNFLNNLEKVERNPIQINSLPEHQKLNQSQNAVSNQPIQTENKIKIADLGTSQNFAFIEKSEREPTPNEIENNLPASFEKVIEKAVKETNVVETTLKNQTESTKIAEQINPHLVELANLVEKKQEKEILKLRLHPAELGTVEITLERDKSGVLNAHFRTETEGAQQALSNGLDQLRDTLQNAGWEVGQLDISNGSSSSTSNQTRHNNQQKSESVENSVLNRNSEQPDETESNSPTRLLSLQA